MVSQTRVGRCFCFCTVPGERGTDLEIVKRGGPSAMIERGEDPAMIVVSPQCPLNQTWDPTRLLALLDHLEQQFAVGHVVVTGYSMGGYGTWTLAQAAPQRFAAIAPLCGGGDAGQAEVLKNLPIWAFHGEKDKVVPLSQSQAMVDSVSAAGGDAKLTVYADEGHGICRLTYANPELFQWFLSHCRSADDAGTTMVHRQGKRSCDPSELVSL